MSAPSPLRIALIGVGSIGSTFAFQLSRVGHHDLTAVARPGSLRLQQLQRDHGVVTVKGEHAEMSVTDALDEQVPYDVVIVTLLAHQLDAVLPALQRSAAKSVLFMFTNFAPERQQELFGAERCGFGMPLVQATLDEEGRLDATIGNFGQKTLVSDQRWADVFTAAGLPAVVEPKMTLWLRCNVPLVVAMASVCVSGKRRGGGAAWGECMALARGVRECFTLVRRQGYKLYPSSKGRVNSSPLWAVALILWALSRVRSFRELLANGIGESQALVDTMVEAAERADPPVVIEKIKAMRPSQ